MASTVVSRDVQEIVTKLTSDKAKAREDGIKLLTTLLESNMSDEFCQYLSENSSMLKPNEIPHAETWPFLIKILINCVSLEIASSKKRPPKSTFAKALKLVVLKVREDKCSGEGLLLLPVAKILFNHVCDVLNNVSSLYNEYAGVLRRLLAIKHYKFYMRRRAHHNLTLLFMEKAQSILFLDNIAQATHVIEDTFRTLQLLLESPPGDISDDLRDDVTRGFIKIFSRIRADGNGKLWKLLDCVNAFLLRDGPNLGCRCLEIHDAVKQFAFRFWFPSIVGHKESLVLYAKLQLSLTRGVVDGATLLEQLLDILSKDLDQMSSSSPNMLRSDSTRDEKCTLLKSPQYSIVELAALVFFRACTNRSRASIPEKCARRENVIFRIKERLVEGKWSWHAVLFFLIRSYSTCSMKDLFIYWFENISANLERMISKANLDNSYDGLLWTLRSLLGLTSSLLFAAPITDSSQKSLTPANEVAKHMHVIWSGLMQSLPTLVNRSSIVDAALMVLRNLLLSDTRDSYFVPLEIWDLQVFKRLPSISVLCFISCYFSQRASQCNHQDALYIRQTMLRAVLALLSQKECSRLNEGLIVAVPAAAYALCVGSTPLLSEALEVSPLHSLPEDMDDPKTGDRPLGKPCKLFDCSVECLAKIEKISVPKVDPSKYYQHIRLPRKLRDQLCHEMENHFIEHMRTEDTEKMLLSEVINRCALLSNFMYASYLTRMRDENLPFFLKLGEWMLELLDQAISIIEQTCSDIVSSRLGVNSLMDNMVLLLASFKSFIHAPVLSKWKEKTGASATLYASIIQSAEGLLKALCKLYQGCAGCTNNLFAKTKFPDLLDRRPDHDVPSDSSRTMIDEDLDEVPGIDGDLTSIFSNSLVNQKLGILSIISSFFAILPSVTWELLYNLKETESDQEVLEYILSNLYQHSQWSSNSRLLSLVTSLTDDVNMRENLKLQYSHVLNGICSLVESLLHMDDPLDISSATRKMESEGCLIPLGDLVNKVAENSSQEWCDRTKIICCICSFVSLNPEISQTMIEKLFLLLRDPDYRVRLCLARRISILFQTWDGHLELFQDICSNFGMKLVNFSRGNVVRAEEVLSGGPTPGTIVETTVTTLLHLVLHSEKIELEAVFMICVVAAIDPSQRELASAALDSISEELCYANRAKYMEELMGPILFHWVACGVSLVALVETRHLFVLNVEPINFVQYCCPWLLPALILQEDDSNLKWIAKVASRPCADLVKHHFVHIFSICIALHCSKSGWDQGSRALGTSILHVAEISEHERDELIRKRMVSIVSHILSLASSVSDPSLPFFSKETIARAIQTVVDGFLESEDPCESINLVDKIHILRPDRVFMFVVDIHHKIAAAAHHRHTCKHMAGIEVLVDILGFRAAIPSTFNYLLNLIGQFIGCHSLMDQCCYIISKLLDISRENPSGETTKVLGEQLQFLVSKLVECCITPKSYAKLSSTASLQVASLLQQLTVGSDTSLYEYIKELEPFPALHMFDNVQRFHLKICQTYSPRAHLMNFVKRADHVPSRLLLVSLKALYRHVFTRGLHSSEEEDGNILKNAYWHSDDKIVHAAWSLVQICSIDNTNNLSPMVSDFISRVGIGDPHQVVFHHSEMSPVYVSGMIKPLSAADPNFHLDTHMSDEVIIVLMRLLNKFLMDDSVEIIEMTSHALRGILSTEKGQQALLQLDSYERSLIEVHSKGVDLELVQGLMESLQQKFYAQSISVEDSTVWSTVEKTFEKWICPLVYSMISYCDDLILRLCQDIVLVKSEVSELLFSNIIINISRREESDDLCKIISLKVKENIFIESNVLIKSTQIILHALNELRLHHVVERTKSSVSLQKLLSSKHTKVPVTGSKSRTASIKSKDHQIPHGGLSTSILLWDKVYWLDLDYLVVAKSAIDCGSYFTAVLYVEHWCEEHFSSLSLGRPDFSQNEMLPPHIEILVSAVTQINEPDSLYGIIQSHKLTSQITTFEHEGNWGKALEYYDLQVRSEPIQQISGSSYSSLDSSGQAANASVSEIEYGRIQRKAHKGLVRSLQQIGCTHVLDVYCQGLTSQRGRFQHDLEFTELQYEAAWRAGNWDFCPLYSRADAEAPYHYIRLHFNENLHSCLRALQEGEFDEFHTTLQDSKQDLLLSICRASKESTEFIYSTTIKLQIFYHLGMAWDLRWSSSYDKIADSSQRQKLLSEPIVPSEDQLQWLHRHWRCILKQTELHMNLLEPFIAFRRVLLQVLNSVESNLHHLLESASVLRKGSRISQAAAALHEFKSCCSRMGEEYSSLYWLGRLEEAKILRAQGQHEMAINLADHVSQKQMLKEGAPDVFRLVGKWLAETRSSNSRTILEKYLKKAVNVAEDLKATDKLSMEKKNQMHFHLAHYADVLFRNHEERLKSNEWQVGMRLRKHKTKELEALIKRYKSMAKGDKTDYSLKIQELQKQLTMDREEADKLEEDRDNFLVTALEGYTRCLVIGEKYDVQVVFRLVSLWFSLSNRQIVVDNMLSIIKEVQAYKFIVLVYQIASRMGGAKDTTGPSSFQFALVSLVKKMAIDHPYHTLIQLLALANGDRIKDKQRSRNSFVVDVDKKVAAEDLLRELTSHHGAIIRQMKQMVEIYIKLAELETRREDTNKKIAIPRDLRSIRQLELVPVITSHVPVDRTCQYPEGFFPFYKGLTDSITVMNGINAPKVVECLGSDGNRYRQLAKSGNDDLRQDAVMEQFFGLVNTFLENNNDTWKRRLRIRTYKVVPFTPSAGVLEWVNGTFPLGEYLIGSSRSGGAHGRYGVGDWNFLKCRQHMSAESDKRNAFKEVCQNFRPVMHYFFLERFSNPADWFEKRLAYTRSVAASSMVGYIVGLGDRHSMNVLIDQATAEVIHIDLGVAFEQGLMLKTPERVPFRLTRDIIDGMGVTGVEGVFRRCCEETVSVMRTNKEALLTIIEVFIHDPLYKWALSPLKAMQRQKDIDDDIDAGLEDSDEDDYEGNKDAARALLRVKQKLDGYEDGEMRSVHGQVQQLIQDAIDPDRLCNMFPGWGAWL